MTSPSEKLAASLKVLKKLQDDGRRVFRSDEFTRVHRERLLYNGYLQEVMKGWVISSNPDVRAGDSTPWYTSFWEFCRQYCTSRFGSNWYLAPEQSLLLLAENSVVPSQLVICSPNGTNNVVELLFGTSLFDLKQEEMPLENDLTERFGVRVLSPIAAIIRVPVSFYRKFPVEAYTVIAGIQDLSDVLRRLLDGGHSTIAGRLAGAFRNIGRGEFADEILSAMKSAMYDVREADPFASDQLTRTTQIPVSPISIRLEALWESMRGEVIDAFPVPPGLPNDRESYLHHVESNYANDAYHSLSIEGYQVTPDLIERVRSGSWDPGKHEIDRQNRDALAARGYWQAFQLVRKAVERILHGENPGSIARSTHQDWYRELFQPYVAAGLIPPAELAGYRNTQVFLRLSRHVPPRSESVPQAMSTIFDLLERESEVSVRAVLGHWLIGYIHPYADGNGRIARFLMNLILASGGYPWTVIRVEDRTDYLSCLETASVGNEIGPFASFIAERLRGNMDSPE